MHPSRVNISQVLFGAHHGAAVALWQAMILGRIYERARQAVSALVFCAGASYIMIAQARRRRRQLRPRRLRLHPVRRTCPRPIHRVPEHRPSRRCRRMFQRRHQIPEIRAERPALRIHQLQPLRQSLPDVQHQGQMRRLRRRSTSSSKPDSARESVRETGEPPS